MEEQISSNGQTSKTQKACRLLYVELRSSSHPSIEDQHSGLQFPADAISLIHRKIYVIGYLAKTVRYMFLRFVFFLN